jgi:hypothetical protein
MRQMPKFVALLFAICSIAASTTAKEMPMLPPAELDGKEKALKAEAIAALPCTNDIRRLATENVTAELESETVSFSDEFGYVYRYLMRKEGDEKIYYLKLVVWTRDCDNWQSAIVPVSWSESKRLEGHGRR